MGNEGYKYNRNERIQNLEKRRDELTTETLNMYHDNKSTTSEILKSWEKKDKIEDDIRRLKIMDEKEKNFTKNINLDEYRNRDGTFNVYKTKRSFKGGIGEDKIIKKLHHEGIAIGNDKKKFFTDYGVGEGDLEVRFWDDKEEKDNWDKIEKVGTSEVSNDGVKDILFGQSSEKWTNHDDYKTLKHNCQDYSKEKITQLTNNITHDSDLISPILYGSLILLSALEKNKK